MGTTTSVVICGYTTRRWSALQAAVASVRNQHRGVEEVILVVDHNEDLLALAAEHLPDVEVVPNRLSRGLSGARNTGVARANGDVVVFLDDDAVAEPDWTAKLLAPYEDPDVLGVGGSAVPRWEEPAPVWLPPEFLWVVGCSYLGQPKVTSAVRNLMGCNMSLRRHVLMEVGGFDPALGRTKDEPLGCEETELCIRALQRFPRGRFLFEPKAVVHHWVPAERGTWRYFRDRCRAEGRSKAWVSDRVGTGAGLSTERAYTREVLPAGLARNLLRGVRGDHAAMRRAGAITAGFALTAGSYVTASVSTWEPGRAIMEAFGDLV
jgi:GT2 family glycosyltransferase